MTGLKDWSTTAANNTDSPPYGAPESTTLVSDLNNIDREIMAEVRGFYEEPLWRNLGLALEATGATNTVVFTGDVSAYVSIGQRIYVTDAGTPHYYTVSNVSVSTNTTVTVNASTVTHPVSSVLLSIMPDNDPIPATALDGTLDVDVDNSAVVTASLTVGSSGALTAIDYVADSWAASGSATLDETTGLPSTIKRIEIILQGISSSGASGNVYLALGDSSGYASTSGGVKTRLTTAVSNTNYSGGGVLLWAVQSASQSYNGRITCVRDDSSDTGWWVDAQLSDTVSSVTSLSTGWVTLPAGPLDRLKMTISSGNFDAGTADIHIWA